MNFLSRCDTGPIILTLRRKVESADSVTMNGSNEDSLYVVSLLTELSILFIAKYIPDSPSYVMISELQPKMAAEHRRTDIIWIVCFIIPCFDIIF